MKLYRVFGQDVEKHCDILLLAYNSTLALRGARHSGECSPEHCGEEPKHANHASE